MSLAINAIVFICPLCCCGVFLYYRKSSNKRPGGYLTSTNIWGGAKSRGALISLKDSEDDDVEIDF